MIRYTPGHEARQSILFDAETPLSHGNILRSDLRAYARFFAARCAGQDRFPEGFDAVEVAPQSHKVLYENAFVRVLQVQVAPGAKEPMHHHRWPSFFLVWDTGGRTGHIKIYHQDGSIHDVQSRETPVSPGSWLVTWLKPEPMHSIENVETPESAATLPKKPPTIRVELKFAG